MELLKKNNKEKKARTKKKTYLPFRYLHVVLLVHPGCVGVSCFTVGDIGSRDTGLLSAMMELDDTWPVVLKVTLLDDDTGAKQFEANACS